MSYTVAKEKIKKRRKEGNMKIWGFGIDIARQIECEEHLEASIKRMLSSGYNTCLLHLEDAFQFATHPGIARRHAYSPGFMRRIYKCCEHYGAELIPVIPSLGHCKYISSKNGYEKYDEGFGTGQLLDTLVAGREDVYVLLKALYEDWTKNIPGTYLHVGLDECPAVGYSFIREHGKENFDAAETFADHANRLCRICKELGRRMIIWGDMLYYFPSAMDLLDKDIIIADWYYYHFDSTPKIEMFNFAPVDLTGELRNRGFEVWGIPSVWPVLPIPDIRDRFANLKDWIRYGEERNIAGIINCDWENSFGFFPTTELLFHTFAEISSIANQEELAERLSDVFTEIAGIRPEKDFISDLLKLGGYHLTGHANRVLLDHEHSMRSSAPERISEYRTKALELERLLPDVERMLEECELASGKELLKTIIFCRDFLRLFWKSAAVMSDISSEPEIYEVLALKLDKFAAQYTELWGALRYEDDKMAVAEWARRQSQEFRSLAAGEESGALLELVLCCEHPAMPILEIEIYFSDGTVQETREIMIKFESSYSVPDKTWEQYPAIRLKQAEIPREIRLSSTHYGQIGIKTVKINTAGEDFIFIPGEKSGKYVKEENGILWLGPRGAEPGDPTFRLESDSAVYHLAQGFVK